MATLVDKPVNQNLLSIERLWRPWGLSVEFCMTASVMTRASQSDPFLLSYISLLGPRARSNVAGMVPITVLMCALSCQLLKCMWFRSGLFVWKEKWEFNGCRCCVLFALLLMLLCEHLNFTTLFHYIKPVKVIDRAGIQHKSRLHLRTFSPSLTVHVHYTLLNWNHVSTDILPFNVKASYNFAVVEEVLNLST